MGQKTLLKTVLIKSTAAMASTSKSKSSSKYVYGLAHRYCQLRSDYDMHTMERFMADVKKISGDCSGLISGDVPEDEVRSHLEGAIPMMLSVLENERPDDFAAINGIDWRRLFLIGAEPPVQIIKTAASDDDSGNTTPS